MKCDMGKCETCIINSDRDDYKVSIEDMNKYGLCFTMNDDEYESMIDRQLYKGIIKV